MKRYRYEALNKCCKNCEGPLLEDFRLYEDSSITRTGFYCPTCKMADIRQMESYHEWIAKVRHILLSEEKQIIRKIEDHELKKFHGIDANWFPLGKKVYVEPEIIEDEAIRTFKEDNITSEKVLVYLPNNYLQRLYFFVPKDAIK